ncbi:MAG: FAD-binding oxidoreductase, partial [Proteobacteria bacterium]|nr:FAD-binding oxidoreductase [Pseudomonadota bacterium]
IKLESITPIFNVSLQYELQTELPKLAIMGFPTRKSTLSSFDGTQSFETEVLRPDRYKELMRAVRDLPKVSLIGAGLSYTSASAGSGYPAINMSCFNRLLGFDASTGQLRVEPSVCLGDALRFAVSRGWNMSVLPGHPSITVGGCVALNVHGKSQFSSGNFENIVIALTLFHPDHGEVHCSRSERPDLFWLTVGGLGLTGVILDVTLQLSRLKGAVLERHSIPANNLRDAATKLAELQGQFDYLYSWNNLTRRGNEFGRGVIYAEKFVGDPAKSIYGSITSKLTPVEKRPSFSVFRGETAPLINRIYETKERFLASTKQVPIGPGTFPIAGKEFYFSLLGRRGFREYQCIFPQAAVGPGLVGFERLVAKFNINPSLGSLKYFRGYPRDLCFQQTGICIAMDVPLTGNPSIIKFMSELDSLVVDQGGIANIAKDSRLSREVAAKMYPDYGAFWQRLVAWDPAARFTSEVRCRLEPI